VSNWRLGTVYFADCLPCNGLCARHAGQNVLGLPCLAAAALTGARSVRVPALSAGWGLKQGALSSRTLSGRTPMAQAGGALWQSLDGWQRLWLDVGLLLQQLQRSAGGTRGKADLMGCVYWTGVAGCAQEARVQGPTNISTGSHVSCTPAAGELPLSPAKRRRCRCRGARQQCRPQSAAAAQPRPRQVSGRPGDHSGSPRQRR
jgi:hypothetical protein